MIGDCAADGGDRCGIGEHLRERHAKWQRGLCCGPQRIPPALSARSPACPIRPIAEVATERLPDVSSIHLHPIRSTNRAAAGLSNSSMQPLPTFTSTNVADEAYVQAAHQATQPNRMEFGLVGLNEARTFNFSLTNPNPVPITISNWRVCPKPLPSLTPCLSPMSPPLPLAARATTAASKTTALTECFFVVAWTFPPEGLLPRPQWDTEHLP